MKSYSIAIKAFLALAALALVVSIAPKPAMASEQGRRNTALALTGITLYQALRGHVPEAILGAGASAIAWDRVRDRDWDDHGYYRPYSYQPYYGYGYGYPYYGYSYPDSGYRSYSWRTRSWDRDWDRDDRNWRRHRDRDRDRDDRHRRYHRGDWDD